MVINNDGNKIVAGEHHELELKEVMEFFLAQ